MNDPPDHHTHPHTLPNICTLLCPRPTPPHAAAAKEAASPTIKADLEAGATANGGAAAGSSTLPFRPLCMTFKDMRYSVPFPKVGVCAVGVGWGRCC